MSCEYCEAKENKVLISTDCDETNFDIYVARNAPLLVAMSSTFVDQSEIEINFCPMCGRSLKQRMTPAQEHAYKKETL